MELRWIVLTFTLCCVRNVYTADPVLSWTSWTDSVGNTADQNSDVTFAPIPMPSNLTYKGGAIEYDSRGLEPLYKFTKAFINGAVFPYGLDWNLIDKFINGTLITDVTSNYMDYVKQYAGYGALIVIGFLFIFIFPLIGCCFCCCRCCCSNCGGKMKQSPKDAQNHCKRRTFAVILLVLIAFTVAGMVCVYISNDQMTDTLTTFDTSAKNALDDLDTFIDVFVGQIKHIAQTNFNFTRDVIYRDLDSIGYIVGIPVRDILKSSGGVDTAINSANDLAAKVDEIANALLDLNTSLTFVKSNATALSTAASTLKTNIEADKTTCGTSCNSIDVTSLETGVDADAFPDMSDQLDKISSVQTQNLSAVIIQAKQSFEDIPWRVQNETNQTVADIKKTVDDVTDKIQPMIDQAESFKSSTSGSLNIGQYKDTIGNYTKLGVDYNQYRWYGGIGLTSIILLIVVLLLIGLMFAVCGHSADAAPTERSGLSSCGGHMFMAAVGFVFIFSSLLMLLTMIIFILGSPLHRFICEPITDPDLTDLQYAMDNVIYSSMYGGSGSLLGKVILQNSSHSLTLKKVLGDCEAGKSAYSAFQLEDLIDVSALTNISGSLDVNSQVDNINIDLSSLEILTDDLKTQLEDLKTSANINFTQFREQFAQDSMKINLTELSSQLRALAGTQANFSIRADETDAINNNELPAFNGAMSDLESKLNALEVAVNGTSENVDTTIDAFNSTQTYLQTNGSQAIKDEVKNYANRILKVVDYLVNDTLDGLNNEIGACTPVWNLYNDIFVVSFCKYLVDTLNGFWFGLGWCIFFFLPSIIFATKLAKHYRRMKMHDFDDSYEKGGGQLPEVNRHSSSPDFASKHNKVGHSDPKNDLTGW